MTQRFELVRLRLVGDDDIDTSMVEREFPTVRIERTSHCDPSDIIVDDYVWRGAFDLRTLDEKIEQATDALTFAGSYKVVFLAFPLEAYGTAADKADLVGRTLTFFGP